MTSSSQTGPESYYFVVSGFGEGNGNYYYNGIWAGGNLLRYTVSSGYSIQTGGSHGLAMGIWEDIGGGTSIAKYYSSNYTTPGSFVAVRSTGYPAGILPTGTVTQGHIS